MPRNSFIVLMFVFVLWLPVTSGTSIGSKAESLLQCSSFHYEEHVLRKLVKLDHDVGLITEVEIKKQTDDIRLEMEKLKTDIGGLKTLNEDMKEEMANMKKEIGGLKTLNADIKLEMVKMKEKSDEMKVEMDRLKNQTDNFKLEMDNVKKQTEVMKDEQVQIKRQTDEIKLVMKEMKTQTEEMKDEIKKQSDQFKQESSETKRQFGGLKTEIVKIKELNEKTKQEQDKIKQQNEKTEKEILDIKERNDKTEQETIKQRTQNKNFKREMLATFEDLSRMKNRTSVAVNARASQDTYSSSAIVKFSNFKTSVGLDNVDDLKSTGKFTCTLPGLYLVSFTLMSNTNDAYFYVYKNNDLLNWLYIGPLTSGYREVTGVFVLELQAGDTVYVRCGKQQFVYTYSMMTIVKID